MFCCAISSLMLLMISSFAVLEPAVSMKLIVMFCRSRRVLYRAMKR